MSTITKVALTVIGLVLGFTALANATPPSHTTPSGNAIYQNDAPPKNFQDRFDIRNS